MITKHSHFMSCIAVLHIPLDILIPFSYLNILYGTIQCSYHIVSFWIRRQYMKHFSSIAIRDFNILFLSIGKLLKNPFSKHSIK